MKMLRSRNKFRGFAVDITRKKMVCLVFQVVVHGDRKVREKVMVGVFETSLILK
jgi:hypothetical protein